jgi:hypothetical protein
MTSKSFVNAAAARIAPELAAEWDEMHQDSRARVVADLRAYGATPQALEYIGTRRLYLRSPWFFSVWVPEREDRREVSYDLARHMVGLKLFDDLLDQDSGLDQFDHGYAQALWNASLHSLCRRSEDPLRILRLFDEGFVPMSVSQVQVERAPARTMAQWRSYADQYGAGVMGCYAAVGTVSGNRLDAVDAAYALGFGFGMLITVADDLTDYDTQGKREGNLGQLLLTGAATVEDITGLVEQMRALAVGGADVPPVYDVEPVIDAYADDVLGRLLPRFTARMAS